MKPTFQVYLLLGFLATFAGLTFRPALILPTLNTLNTLTTLTGVTSTTVNVNNTSSTTGSTATYSTSLSELLRSRFSEILNVVTISTTPPVADAITLVLTNNLELNVTDTILNRYSDWDEYNKVSQEIEILKVPFKYQTNGTQSTQRVLLNLINDITANASNATDLSRVMDTRQLYDDEGLYFSSMLHYKDSWSQWKQYLSDQGITLKSKWTDQNMQTEFPSDIVDDITFSLPLYDYPIKPYFLRSSKPRHDDMITIVTQCSLSRLYMIYHMAERWTDIMSIAIYIPMEDNLLESEEKIVSFFNYIDQNMKAILDISLLYETEFKIVGNRQLFRDNQDRDPHRINNSISDGYVWYPVNHLRNLALQMAETDFVFLLDADFIPTHNFANNLRRYYGWWLKQMKKNAVSGTHKPVALVTPAYEHKNFQNLTQADRKVPKSVQDLMDLADRNATFPFHWDHATYLHEASNYSRFEKIAKGWSAATMNNEAFKLAPYKVAHNASAKYEPYVLVLRKNLHRYDARLRGYGYNKISHLQQMRALDYTFYVVPNLFVFHKWHEESQDRNFRKTGGDEVSHNAMCVSFFSWFKQQLNSTHKYNITGHIIA